MPNQILQVDENMLETKLDRLVSEKVEQLLNAMLDAEADEITDAARYERSGCISSNWCEQCRHLFWTLSAFRLDGMGGWLVSFVCWLFHE